MLSLLLACTGTVDDDKNPGGGDDTAGDVETTLAPEPAAYDGDCPDISGDFTIQTSAGQSRDLKVVLPDNPEGAPVVFAWHPLGGTASYAISAFGLDDLAAEGWVVIAPETASGSAKPAFEWGFIGDPDMGAADLVPGVSGGTVALITGIYGRLISAIASVGIDMLSLVFRGRVNR